jgi:uncharacterized protein YjcR
MDFTRSFGALRARDLMFQFKTERDMVQRESQVDPRFTNENVVQAESGESAA